MSLITSLLAAIMIGLAVALGMAEPTVPGPQDEQLVLQATATQTASANSAALDMGSGYAPGGVGQPVAAVIQVTAIDRVTGDETYNFKLQESSDNSAWTDISPNVATTVVGVIVAKGILTKRYVRLATTLAGTTPSVTYKAYLNPRPM